MAAESDESSICLPWSLATHLALACGLVFHPACEVGLQAMVSVWGEAAWPHVLHRTAAGARGAERDGYAFIHGDFTKGCAMRIALRFIGSSGAKTNGRGDWDVDGSGELKTCYCVGII